MLKKQDVVSYLKQDKPNPLKDMFLYFKSKINFSYFTKKQNQIFLIKTAWSSFILTVKFISILTLYISYKVFNKIGLYSFIPKIVKEKILNNFNKFYDKAVLYLDRKKGETISKIDLIDLAFKNMKLKKTRTLITIGGMTIGIAVIVFLVSIGYGLQNLVITRITRLDELKQIDISSQVAKKIKITDDTISKLLNITNIKEALPLISVVGRINFQNSISDVAVYGVTSNYMEQSAIKPIKGKIFESNNIKLSYDQSSKGEVAGVYTEKKDGSYLDKIQDVEISINPDSWIRVREMPSVNGPILGYTKRVEGQPQAEEYWGGTYSSDNDVGEAGENSRGEKLGKWIKASVLLWEETTCDSSTDGDCEEGKYKIVRDESNKQSQKEGFFAEVNLSILNKMTITEAKDSNVLGIAIEGEAETTDSAFVDWVDIASESAILKNTNTKKVPLAKDSFKKAIVNRAMLKILGINENNAIGKKFTTSFVVVGELLTNQDEKIESIPEEYEIIGVIPEDKVPFMYVPFIDLRGLGIINYSQIKLVTNSKETVPNIRKQVEAMGYNTKSVLDTVSQITSLFSTARTLLAFIGLIALAIASLGMFNTLTVSLLERTREVGLMKAMGMKSSEIRELFLTESIIMGFFGGILGIILGSLAGKLLGLFLSIFSVFKGIGFIDISHIPISFIILILILSLLVGLLTGIYPAKRAKKISALNALRYE